MTKMFSLIRLMRRIERFGSMAAHQRQALLRVLETATRYGLPVPSAIDALAGSESGDRKHRLQLLANRIHNGEPLYAALTQSTGLLAQDEILGIQLGARVRKESEAIRCLIAKDDLAQSQTRAMVQIVHGAFYFLASTAILCSLGTFMMIWIWPTFVQIMADFEIVPTPIFELVTLVANEIATYWYLVPLAGIFLICALATLIRNFGIQRLLQPVLDFRSHNFLKHIHVAAATGVDPREMLELFQQKHHNPSVRRRIKNAQRWMHQGTSMWNSLYQVGLMSFYEAQLFANAEQVGNLVWVAKQLTTKKRQRIQKRIDYVSQLMMPIVHLIFGFIILCLAAAVFSCLAVLTSVLARP